MTTLPPLVDGATRLYGIVGHPIAQVRSPEVMTKWLRDAGHNAILIPMHVLPERFEATVRGIMDMVNMHGLVITVPYKARATALADNCLPNAERVGAINALRRNTDGTWSGEIFDGVGLVRSLEAEKFQLQGCRVKMLGAGGAGSAVGIALAQAGAASIEIFDVDQSRAVTLAERITKHFPDCSSRYEAHAAALNNATLLVNCTPIGMKPGEGMPAAFGALDPSLMVVDVIMKPAITPLAEHARACGCRVMNGIPMLDNQAQAVMEFLTENK